MTAKWLRLLEERYKQEDNQAGLDQIREWRRVWTKLGPAGGAWVLTILTLVVGFVVLLFIAALQMVF